MTSTFTPFHRGGSGPPLVLIHGFLDTWRTWELVLPALERRHEVFAFTLPGHAGGPALPAVRDETAFLDAVAAILDEAGIDRAPLVGNSLGGYVALSLAARGRAESVVALAPAGGWAVGDGSYNDLLRSQHALHRQLESLVPYADAIVSSPAGRRRATELLAVNYDHIPAPLLAHQLVGAARAEGADALVEGRLERGWTLEAERITCPVRVVWGTEDRLLPWPTAAVRYQRDWLPHADWVVLDGVGHCPQLDVPLETAELILGFTD